MGFAHSHLETPTDLCEKRLVLGLHRLALDA